MIKEWLTANPIGIEDGLRHDKWCAMMWPRLRLLHELLADDGSIWVTLDDNEIHRFKHLLDEIFGEDGFIAQIVIQSNKRGQTYKDLAKTHEYLLVYGRSNSVAVNEIETEGANLPLADQHGNYSARELRNRNPKFGRHNRPNLFYPFYVSETSKDADGNYLLSLEEFLGAQEVYPKNSEAADSCWRWGKERAKKFIGDGSTEFIFGAKTRNGEWRVFEKYRKESIKAETIWDESKFISEQGTVELGQLGLAELFQFPKPLGMLETVIALATSENSIVLDSFAGSGTTAHAVLEANKRDGGNRRFILVEMEDYADRLTAERVRRVINGYDFTGTQKTELLRERLNWRAIEKSGDLVDKVEGIENLYGHEYDRIKKEVKDGELIVTGEKRVEDRAEGLGGAFTYCTLGDPIDLDGILTGAALPSYDALAGWLFHMATSQPLDPAKLDEANAYVGEANGTHVWLIYRPDLEWLKSPDAALTLSFARQVAGAYPDARHFVFAPARYVSQRMLDAEGLPVEFVPLPHSLYRMERD